MTVTLLFSFLSHDDDFFYHSLSVCCPNQSQILCLRGQKLKYGNVPLRHLVLTSKFQEWNHFLDFSVIFIRG